jgi:hypothetical protein
MSDETVTISVDRFDELRKIEEKAQAIIFKKEKYSIGFFFLSIFSQDKAEINTTEYIGEDEAKKLLSDEATKNAEIAKKAINEAQEWKSKYDKILSKMKSISGKIASFEKEIDKE